MVTNAVNLEAGSKAIIWYSCRHCGFKLDAFRLHRYLESRLPELLPSGNIYRERNRTIAEKRSKRKTSKRVEDSGFITLRFPLTDPCPRCNKALSYETSVSATESDIKEDTSHLCLDAFHSDQLKLAGKPFMLVKGKEIKKTIDFLVKQWFFRKGNIRIVSPFLNRSDWYRLVHGYSNLEYIENNPIITIITRNAQKDFEIEKKFNTINDRLKALYEEVWETRNENQGLVLREGEKNFISMDEHLKSKKPVELLIFPKDFDSFIKNSNIIVTKNKTSTFHSKFYSATIPESNIAQILATSCNYTEITAEQIESVSYIELSQIEFIREYRRLRRQADLTRVKKYLLKKSRD
ncbi:MAG: hypothetical protein ACFFD4_24050 [Candidatus Odinarchaeota archaeon]